ncbi:MAG: ABC transporter permease [Lachnospiraceae bacterium]|nr:ABC transporter permease [Lachnospiraceae bacterium]
MSKKRIKNLIIASILLVILLLITGGLELAKQKIEAKHTEQKVGKEYGQTVPYTLISFMQGSQSFQKEQLLYYNRNVAKELDKASISSENEDARLYLYSFYAEEKETLSYDKSFVNSKVKVIGGDYFLFHKPKLLSGSYLLDNGNFSNYIVLDELCAWKLFGSFNVTGKEVKLGESRYYVCGVIARNDKNNLWLRLNGETPVAYVLHDSPEYLKNTIDYSNYELLLPNPVEGFAKGIAEQIIPQVDGENEIIDHSNLFSYKTLLKKAVSLNELAMQQKNYSYTPEENLIAVSQMKASFVVLFELIFLILSFIDFWVIIGICWKPLFTQIDRVIAAIKKKL